MPTDHYLFSCARYQFILPLFQKILSSTNDSNPCIILPDVEMKELRAIIEFIYRGEISFLINQLPSLLSVAELLGIHGLNEVHVHHNQFTINCKFPQLVSWLIKQRSLVILHSLCERGEEIFFKGGGER